MKRQRFTASVKTWDETSTLITVQTVVHASYTDIPRQMVIFWPDSCCEYPYQKRAAPPRPPIVTSISPSSFKSISPCTDWPKNLTFSPSPPDAIRCEKH